MSDQNSKIKFPLPPTTSAFICANCGAVSLYASGVCSPQGKGLKSDWCGIKHLDQGSLCKNDVNNDRYQCKNCGQVSTTPELLCEPEKMSK